MFKFFVYIKVCFVIRAEVIISHGRDCKCYV